MPTNLSGARPAPAAPKKPAAHAPGARRPAMPTFGTDNNNQDSHKQPRPSGNAPDTHVNTPGGKP